jgi:hypothetical protein
MKKCRKNNTSVTNNNFVSILVISHVETLTYFREVHQTFGQDRSSSHESLKIKGIFIKESDKMTSDKSVDQTVLQISLKH